MPDSVPLFEPVSLFEPYLLEPAPLATAASVFDDLFEDASPVEHGEFPDADINERELSTTEPDSTPGFKLNELPDVEAIEKEQRIDEGDPETNEPFNEDIARLRPYASQIGWGKTWYAVSKNKAVG